MKIEIDLNDILGDSEYGVETLQDSVKRQVVAALTAAVQKGIQAKVDAEVSRAIDESIAVNIKALTPKIFDDLMNAEYTPVDRWGDSRGKPTTFRKELVSKIQEEMVYKKADYDSQKTVFTRAVDSMVSEHLVQFKKEYQSTIDAEFTKQALAHATSALQQKLGIK